MKLNKNLVPAKLLPPAMEVFASRWPTPEARKNACERLKNYLRQGRDLKLWDEASYDHIQQLIDAFPEEFNKVEIFDAFRRGVADIEKEGIAAAKGHAKKGFDFGAFRMIMMNKAGWKDRIEMQNIAEINDKIAEIAEKVYAVAIKFIPKSKLGEFALEMQGAIRAGVPDGRNLEGK